MILDYDNMISALIFLLHCKVFYKITKENKKENKGDFSIHLNSRLQGSWNSVHQITSKK